MATTFIVEEWRDLWNHKSDFLVVCFVYVFSFSNFIHLPKMVAENGGGAFVVAYLISALTCCLPLVLMELTVGQQCTRAPYKALRNLCPLFAGVGISLVVYSLFMSSVLVTYVAYALSFLVDMFLRIGHRPPWTVCDSPWNTGICVPLANKSSMPVNAASSLEEFFNYHVLNMSNSMEEPGEIQWMSISAMAITCGLLLMALFLGVKFLGKVCYFTFTIPFLLLLILLVKSLSTDGADYIIKEFFNTDWNMLLDTKTWMLAFSQSLYGTGLCFGAYITLGSYHKRSNNFVTDTLLVFIAHLVLSAIGLFTAASLMGNLAAKLGLESPRALFDKGFTQFLRLLEAVGNYEHPHLWSAILLFIVIFLLLNAIYVITFNLCSSIEDAVGAYGSKFCIRIMITVAVSVLCFLTSMGYSTQSGFYGLTLVDSFLDLVSPWVIVTFEIMMVAWFYCAHLLAIDMKQMIESRFWKVFAFPLYEILYILPVVPIYILVIKLSNYNLQQMVGHSAQWVEAVGWIVTLVPVLPIFILMIYCVVNTFMKGPGLTYMEKFKYTIVSPLRHEAVKPTSNSRYTSTAPGYVLLQQAPLAEAEQFNELYADNTTKISHI